MLANSTEVEAVKPPPHGKDMLKKKKTTTTTTTTALIKKGDAWTYLRLAWVLLVLSYSHHSVR